MPRDFPRTRRVADQLQRELAEAVRDEMSDPRLGSVTVSEVKVSRDLGVADVMVTVLGAEPEESRAAVDVLNHAAGFLRGQLGRRMRLRTVPVLRFHYDDSFDRGARLSRLIDQVAPGGDDSDSDSDGGRG